MKLILIVLFSLICLSGLIGQGNCLATVNLAKIINLDCVSTDKWYRCSNIHCNDEIFFNATTGIIHRTLRLGDADFCHYMESTCQYDGDKYYIIGSSVLYENFMLLPLSVFSHSPQCVHLNLQYAAYVWNADKRPFKPREEKTIKPTDDNDDIDWRIKLIVIVGTIIVVELFCRWFCKR